MSRGRRPNNTASNLRQFMDPVAYPSIWGYGNKSNGRVDLRPTQKRIIVDGTTSTSGNYYHVASFYDAKGIFVRGDWILLPGGQTSTTPFNELWTGSTFLGGTSIQNLGVIGTFDPAHNTNSVGDEVYYNTKRHKLDLRGLGPDLQIMYYTRGATDPATNLAFVNLEILVDGSDASATCDIYGPGGNIYWENCTRNGVQLNYQGNTDGIYSSQPVTSLTSSGTTATAFTSNTAVLAVGKKVAVLNRGTGDGSAQFLQSLTAVGTTATATIIPGDPARYDTLGLTVGGKVRIYLANQPEYNGEFTVTAVNPGVSFEFTLLSAPSVSPATGGSVIYYNGNGIFWESIYCGIYTVTAINPGVSFSYTFAGNNNVACAGSVVFSIPSEDVPTDRFLVNVEQRFCGMLYGNSRNGGRGGSDFGAYVNGATYTGCMDFMSGGSKNMNRCTSMWNFPDGSAISGITSVGTLATALISNTYSLAKNDYIRIDGAAQANYNGWFKIDSIVPNVSVSYVMPGTAVSPATGTLVWGAWNAVPGSAQDGYKHAQYLDDSCRNVYFNDHFSAWDSSNPKLCCNALTVKNWISWRTPIGLIVAPGGNNKWANPLGVMVKIDHWLSVHSANDNDIAEVRGFGPVLQNAVAGSYFRRGFMFNNDTYGGGSRGVLPYSNAMNLPVQTVCEVDQLVMSGWPAQDVSLSPDSGTNTTFTNCTWPVSSTSGGNTTLSSMPLNYQAIANSVLSRDIFTVMDSFPQYFSTVARVTDAGTLIANQRQTEINAFEYMCNNMIPDGVGAVPNPWCAIFDYHFISALVAR